MRDVVPGAWWWLPAALTWGLGCHRAPEPVSPPDVLLVVLDTVRADRLSTYGHDRPTSLQLDEIARAGVVFEDVTVPGTWSWPVHASLFTGLAPWEHGAHWRTEVVVPELSGSTGEVTQGAGAPGAGVASGTGSATPVPDSGERPIQKELSLLRSDVPTLAERLGAEGYRTVLLSSNTLLHPSLGLSRGFERAECFRRDSDTVDAARSALSESSDRPLLLVVNLMSGHAPWWVADGVPWSARHREELESTPPPEWARPYVVQDEVPGLFFARNDPTLGYSGEAAFATGALELSPDALDLVADLYDGSLVRLDHALKDLVAAWNGVDRSSGVLVVTSDHGEALGAHGRLGHGSALIPEVLDVPLVVAAPGRLPAGQRVSSPVQAQEIVSAVLELSGVSSDHSPGTSRLVRLAQQGGAVVQDPEFVVRAARWANPFWARELGGEFTRGSRMYRRGAWVLRTGEEFRQAELFDLSTDPGMLHDLAAQEPERREALLVEARDAFPEQDGGTGMEPLPDEVTEALEALGYLGF
ncbi:MAG: sulfatase-like hydrolase/transferase [Myxococcota bacterium]|nr:sulfatase-like hydrolase/transferase [Myxococcota bacterium]